MVFCADDRLMRVLDAVVSSYIRRGVPVGSRYLWSNYDIGLGPASIRHLLAELEGRGLLEKPHVSAGRVPTEKAYRSYLDRLGGPPALDEREARVIHNAMDPHLAVNELLEKVSRLLGALSNKIGVAVVPPWGDGQITRLETVSVGSDGLVVSITMEPGNQRTVTLIPDGDASLADIGTEIARVAGMIIGKTPGEARRIMSGLRLSTGKSRVRFDGLWVALEEVFHDRGYGVHLSGTGNMVSELPEGELKSCLEILESREAVVDMLLSGSRQTKASVTLGSETGYNSMRGCGIVVSTYNIGTAKGALGIIGPVRMEYPRLMAVLEFTSDQLNRLFAGRGGERSSAAEKEKR
jgi:heat-inducible transcriptional repressor